MRTLTIDELREQLDRGERFQMIDVRGADEFAAGHVPCAVNLPMDQVEARLDDLHHRDPVLLICQSGRRAALTRELLRPHLNELVVLEGGTAAWTRAGLPLVRATATRWALERQVRLAAGVITAIGAALAITVDPVWALVPLGTGAGLTFAGLTNVCGMAALLGRMPWNRPRKAMATSAAGHSSSCCG
jgi:rhodanese-related sulfurtransferase